MGIVDNGECYGEVLTTAIGLWLDHSLLQMVMPLLLGVACVGQGRLEVLDTRRGRT